jgi:hypothetical protein
VDLSGPIFYITGRPMLAAIFRQIRFQVDISNCFDGLKDFFLTGCLNKDNFLHHKIKEGKCFSG